MRHDRDACTATHTRLGNVSTGEDIKIFALRVPEMASKYNSKELVPALVRRILGFNRAKCSVNRKPEPVQKTHTGHIIGGMHGTA